MSVQLTSETAPGDLYADPRGSVYRIHSVFTMPTVTMEEVTTGSQNGGGIGCQNLERFTSIGDLDKSKLLEIIDHQVQALLDGLQERADLRDRVLVLMEGKIELKERLFEMKHGEPC